MRRLTKQQIISQEQLWRAQLHAVLESRCDANETIFLERELVQVRAKVFQVQFADKIARTLVPLADDIAPSADTYTYQIYTRVGRARIGANGSNDIPRIDLQGREETGKVRTIDDSYGFNLLELREAARIGKPIEQQKPAAARDAIDEGIDEMLAFGDLARTTGQANVGCYGLINNPFVEQMGIGNPTHDVWTDATDSLQIIGDMNAQLAVLPTESNQKYRADRLIYAPREYELISRKPFSANSDKTILRWFLENNPGLQISQWHRLTGKGAAGANRSIAYKFDKLVLEGVVPLDFEQLPPQATGFDLVINCLARCGGVKVYNPLGIRYTDFAAS